MTITRHGMGPRISKAVSHGNTVYLAGQVADDTSADMKGQTEQVLRKIDAILESCGSHKSKILSATVWVADMDRYEDMNRVWAGWVDQANTPARATVEARLGKPDYLVEIMAIAAL